MRFRCAVRIPDAGGNGSPGGMGRVVANGLRCGNCISVHTKEAAVSEASSAILEDDPSILGFMQEALADAGYAVVMWMSARGAQEMLVAAHPAVVVLDIGLEHPRAGMEVLRTMRTQEETAAVPVLVCTADRE